MNKEFLREDLVGFKPYEPEKGDYNIKLDANENPYSHPSIIMNQIINTLFESNIFTRYPDTSASDLTKKIAQYLDVKPENVVCGVGSDQIIDCLLKVIINQGDKIMMPNPSFSMYRHSTVMNHGIPIEFDLKMENDYNYNIDEIINMEKINKPKAIFLCTPNNPTGNILKLDEIIKIIDNVECLVVIDEAYIEFGGDSSIGLIDKYENLVILRTFSKAKALAGLRVGYAIACKKLINMIKLGIPPYNLNTLTQKIAEIILDNIDSYQNNINIIKAERARVTKELSVISFIEKVYDSEANYLFVKSEYNDLASKLKEVNILTRDFSSHPLTKNCIRITVGTKNENDRLIEALKNLYAIA